MRKSNNSKCWTIYFEVLMMRYSFFLIFIFLFCNIGCQTHENSSESNNDTSANEPTKLMTTINKDSSSVYILGGNNKEYWNGTKLNFDDPIPHDEIKKTMHTYFRRIRFAKKNNPRHINIRKEGVGVQVGRKVLEKLIKLPNFNTMGILFAVDTSKQDGILKNQTVILVPLDKNMTAIGFREGDATYYGEERWPTLGKMAGSRTGSNQDIQNYINDFIDHDLGIKH